GTMMAGGTTTPDLSLADALASRRSAAIRDVVPMVVGAAPVSWRGREREASVIGTTHGMLGVRRWRLAHGRFFPEGDPEQPASVAVIGGKLRSELFGSRSPLGEWIRIGDHR